jgi:hypothetical protein
VDINNLGKIGGPSEFEIAGIFVKTSVFGGIVQVRLTEKACRRYILPNRYEFPTWKFAH